MKVIKSSNVPLLDIDDLLMLDTGEVKKHKKKKKKKSKSDDYIKKVKKKSNSSDKKKKKCKKQYRYENNNILQRFFDSFKIKVKSKINVDINDDTITKFFDSIVSIFKYFIDRKKIT